MNTTAILTPRENEIAECLAWGHTKKEIASKKYISIRTVETTAKNIYEKTGVRSVGQLAAWWFVIRLNLQTLRDPLLSLLFLLLSFANEFNSSHEAMRVKCRSVRTVRVAKGKRNDV